MRNIKLLAIFLLLLVSASSMKAQYVYGTSGLLHAPSGEMQKDKTFMFGGSFLHEQATPKHWGYNTANYYLNITIFPWLEVAYTLTLHKAEYGSTYFPQEVWGKYCNQDRQFAVRLRVWKEGWWKDWTPQIVVGANDPGTNDILGDPDKDDYGYTSTSSVGNGHWNRYYIAATKHFDFKGIGQLGAHVGYAYNKRLDYHLNSPTVGVNFDVNLSKDNIWCKIANGTNVVAEYDGRTVNAGLKYSFWKDYINAVFELTECRYPSGGIVFKVHLK